MKQRTSHISIRSRITLVAVLAIIAPTVVLSLFGLHLVRQQQESAEGLLAKRLQTVAQLKANSIVREVVRLEEEQFNGLSYDDPSKLREELADREKQWGPVKQAFVLDSAERFVYPLMERPANAPPREALPPDVKIIAEVQAKEGDRKAFVEKDLPGALDSYMQYRDQLVEWYEKEENSGRNQGDEPEEREYRGALEVAQAIHRVAALLFKMGQYERCVKEHQVLVETRALREASLHYHVAALYQTTQALHKLNKAPAVAGLLNLYEMLLNETRPRAGEGSMIEFYRNLVVGNLEVVHANGMEDPARARYMKLQEQDAERLGRLKFLGKVKNWWHLRKSLTGDTAVDVIEHVPPEAGIPPTAYKLYREGNDHFLLGFKLDLEYILQDITIPQLEAEFRDTAEASVFNDKGIRLFGVQPDIQSDVVLSFDKPLDFWRIEVAETNPRAAREHKRNLTIVYTSLNLLIVGVIVAGVYLTIRDMNRELQLTRMKSDFVSNVSHELKTPLALIRMFSETLLLDRVKEGRKTDYYDVINRESERLTALISNVLDFSKIDAGRRTYDMKLVCVEDMIRHSLAAYRYELAKEDLEIKVDIEPGLPDILMDGDAISQALLNLLNNAVKYSGDKKEIKVSAIRWNNMLHIAVSDSGIGIDREDQKKIFEMFYRADDEGVRATRGTGLGLAIAKHTAEAHGGTVTVESVRGRGSTFTIVLPVRQQTDDTEA
ncbi:MAG: HAMP domain-containing histidine kinase [Planctomycetes bacterium]|nr:HAMP domain-containing histidine kinase [Planctomycetota bacterium]